MNNSDDQNETDEGGKTDDFSENNSYDSDTSINNSDDQNETDERSKTNDSVMNEPDTLDKIKKEIKDLNEYNYTISSHVFNLYGIKISDIDLDTLLNLPDEIQNLDMKSKIIIKDMLFWLFVMKNMTQIIQMRTYNYLHKHYGRRLINCLNFISYQIDLKTSTKNWMSTQNLLKNLKP